KEALFYSLCDPVKGRLDELFSQFKIFESGKNFRDESFLNSFISITAKGIASFVNEKRASLLLILDCSAGTRYEGYRAEVAEYLERHFTNDLSKTQKNGENLYVMRIIAVNLVQSIIDIIRRNKGESWSGKIIAGYLRYHIRGIAQFFES
ncbi:MAG: hypothetical protein JW728_00550, partial [Candidatus Aureabacteria bacterium]|nr:hypothetical protein [Candidatus Auribacterota bacterium]